ncbi:DUF3616 domain-containing protein [Sphingomonas lenta]|uniref:DUF3616 domain-containing protein n=1 Tax=Sphingomonas lenta TaxID=1141887 RepID=A0A2A2SH68_9SPHN|nr:DUF3616 domain-containing protein [Sphingomonas lenta]PAX08589.1 hypothetical protein CKY28_04225 [Sphingomonas lenta]
MATRAKEKRVKPVGRVTLRFGGDKKRKALSNFSAGTRVGESVFLAADEHADIDRLTIAGQECGEPARFELADLLPLADPEEEADLEGLAADEGWLWVLGSHARTRAKPEKAEGECIDLAALADLNDTRARCLLARLPLVREDGCWTPVKQDGDRRAGMLRQGKKGNAVAKALANDPLVGPFTELPAKEGGVDVEGIAVCGDRVALGMRGPVIAGHALLIEFAIKAKKSGELKVTQDPVFRLMALQGLGVRDLKRVGDDLLILAGPTTGLDGPCALYRWRGWANDPPRDAKQVRLHRPEMLFEIPVGRGCDHPEGLALWNGGSQILVIYDSPAPDRIDVDARTVAADLFNLPS